MIRNNRAMGVMRFIFLTLLLLLATAGQAHAGSTPAPSVQKAPAIILPQDKKPKTVKHYTRAQLDEMNQIYLTCTNSPRTAYYNCQCTAIKYLDGITSKDPNLDRNKLMLNSYLACPDVVEASGTAYKSCMDWAPVLHPKPQAFCECYARRFAKLFKKNSKTFIRDEGFIKQTAMKECDFTGPIERDFTREMEQDKLGSPDNRLLKP